LTPVFGRGAHFLGDLALLLRRLPPLFQRLQLLVPLVLLAIRHGKIVDAWR
jgi:hypothetical protein